MVASTASRIGRGRRWAPVALAGALLAVGAVAAPAAAVPEASTGPAPTQHGGLGAVFHVGAASRSVLPTVDGARDYLADVPEPTDAFSPGVFVPEWDQGTVAVGNGFDESHWVRDDLRASAMAVSAHRDTGPIAVLVSVDLYMLIEPDIDQIRAKVAERLPADVAERVDVLVGATHTHHGPDTVELDPDRQVNHEWFDLMTTEVADAVAEAVVERGPARLVSGSGQHWYGITSLRNPRVVDPAMNVLQAVRPNGDVVATAVQWNGHPEVTLNWRPEVDGELDLSAECAAAGLTPCTAEGRYHTADYPGHVRRVIQDEVGGEVLYFVGALGSMISPNQAVWEVDDVTDLGDHYTPPSGAVFPGTGETDAKDFRRAAIIGEQAGLAALEILAEVGTPITDRTVEIRHERFHSRLSNLGFRYLLRLDGDGRPFLGDAPTPLFLCPDAPESYESCTSDGFASAIDPLLGDEVRVGDHIEAGVSHLRLGPIGMLFVPGEVQGHLVRGLPGDFGLGYYELATLEYHAGPGELTIPGPLLDLVDAPQPWFVGLGQGALGYVIPIDDWRVLCVADAFAPGTCGALNAAGLIAHPDSLSGAQCKAITEDPAGSLGGLPGDVAQALAASCAYGQAFGEAREHYEETNAVGWDVAADLHAAVERMMGVTSDRQVDPDFVTYWEGKTGTPPPAPTAVTATPGNTSLAVSWTPVDGAVSYRVEVLPDGPVGYVAAGSTSTVVSGLANGRPVTVAVSARGDDWLRSPATISDEVTPRPGRPARGG